MSRKKWDGSQANFLRNSEGWYKVLLTKCVVTRTGIITYEENGNHDNPFPKNVNCRSAIWKFCFQNKLLCYFPLFYDLPHVHWGCNRNKGRISSHKPSSPHCTDSRLSASMPLTFSYCCAFGRTFPMTGMFPSLLPLNFHNCRSYLLLAIFLSLNQFCFNAFLISLLWHLTVKFILSHHFTVSLQWSSNSLR